MNNIGEERNVGMVNYETTIRGKDHLKTVSTKLILKKSSNLLLPPIRFNHFRRGPEDHSVEN